MTTLLTSISGQFGKMVALGTLFPVLIVSILNNVISVPLLPFAPAWQRQLSRIATGEDKWATVLPLFVVVVATGVLYNLNIPVIRLYEGYSWKESYLGQLWTRRKKERFRKAGPLRLAMRYLRRQLRNVKAQDALADKVQAAQTPLALYINSELPDREDLVLPTRLGNVIRCFERYSDVAYGMDAIVFWPRLVAKIEPGFASTIDEAKTSLDFMVNSSFLCIISGLGVAFSGLFARTPWSVESVIHWLWRSLFFFGLAVVFYTFAVGRAKAWGEQVKSAFDLYRLDLLKSLGYQQQPLTFFEEKSLWRRISVQLLYADSRERPLPYKTGPTRVTASPAGIQLDVSRQLTPSMVSGRVDVEITLENNDPQPADFVVLSEALPDGHRLMVDSVRVSVGTVTLINMAPLEMMIGSIAPKNRVTVTYAMKAT